MMVPVETQAEYLDVTSAMSEKTSGKSVLLNMLEE
jgi:hypothetical protein